MSPQDLARFTPKYVRTTTGCWQWQAALDPDGYSRFHYGSGMRFGHRVAYEHWVGPVPAGLDLDHLCRNRACVNPQHLEAVTRSENLKRSPLMGAFERAMTHCKRGHDLISGDVRRRADGARVCRACDRLRRAAKRAAT